MLRLARPRRLKSRALLQLERRPACASEDWVSHLPQLIDAACEEWHLSLDDEPMAAGAWGVVAWCHTESGLEAALKLCANEQRLSAETNAMLAWGGHPAVRVLAHRPGALLLERARPGRPSRLAPTRLALLRRASPTDELQPTRARRLAYEHQRRRHARTFLASTGPGAAQTWGGPSDRRPARRPPAGEHP